MPKCKPTCSTVKKILKQRAIERDRGGPKAKENVSGEKSREGSETDSTRDEEESNEGSDKELNKDSATKRGSVTSSGESSDFQKQKLRSNHEISNEADYSDDRDEGNFSFISGDDTEITKNKHSSKTSSLGKSLDSKISKESSRKTTLRSNDKIVEVVSSDEGITKSIQVHKKQRDVKSEGSAAGSSECSVISENFKSGLGIWDQKKQCSSKCLLEKSKEQCRKKTDDEQETLDRYVLNKGFNYFKDMCTCSYLCLYNQIVNDNFIRSTFASAVLFMLGIKLCLELNAWYIPSDILY